MKGISSQGRELAVLFAISLYRTEKSDCKCNGSEADFETRIDRASPREDLTQIVENGFGHLSRDFHKSSANSALENSGTNSLIFSHQLSQDAVPDSPFFVVNLSLEVSWSILIFRNDPARLDLGIHLSVRIADIDWLELNFLCGWFHLSPKAPFFIRVFEVDSFILEFAVHLFDLISVGGFDVIFRVDLFPFDLDVLHQHFRKLVKPSFGFI